MHLKVLVFPYHKPVVAFLVREYPPPDMFEDMGLNSRRLHGRACETNYDFWKIEKHLH